MSQCIPIPFELISLIGELRRVVWKVRKPISHLDLFRLDGFAAVEMRSRLDEQRPIHPRLPADGKPFALRTFAIGLPIINKKITSIRGDQIVLCDETE